MARHPVLGNVQLQRIELLIVPTMRVARASLRSTSVPGILAGTLVALVVATPCRGAMEREVDEALNAARSGTIAPARDLAERLLANDAADWRGWYLRGLAQRDRPLEHSDLARLTDVPAERADALRGILSYMSCAPAARLELAQALVETQPGSALAHTLFASSLLPEGRIEESLSEAKRALELDPGLFLAARVELTALAAQEDAAALRVESCALVRRFAYDGVVLDQALASCTPDADWETRWRDWSPVLHEQKGRSGAALAVQRLLRDPSPRFWPAYAQRAVVAELDPLDRSWWAMGNAVVQHLGGRLEPDGRAALVSFLTTLHHALVTAADPVGDSMMAGTALALSELLEKDGDAPSARRVLETALDRLTPLQRPPLLRRLAVLECTGGAVAGAASHALDAFALTHPFEPVPQNVLSVCGSPISPPDARRLAAKLLQTLPPDAMSSSRLPATPRLLVFFSVDCGSSAVEAKRLIAMLRDPSTLIARHRLTVEWVDVDPAENRDRALAWARDLGIETTSVSFWPYGTALPNALRVAGTPGLFLITPDALVAWEMRGYRAESWAPDVERVLRAMGR